MVKSGPHSQLDSPILLDNINKIINGHFITHHVDTPERLNIFNVNIISTRLAISAL